MEGRHCGRIQMDGSERMMNASTYDLLKHDSFIRYYFLNSDPYSQHDQKQHKGSLLDKPATKSKTHQFSNL